MKKKNHYKKRRRSDIIFVAIMLAFPLTQFAFMWIGVNTGSILMAFYEYDADFNITWTFNNFKRLYYDLFEAGVLGMVRNGVILWTVQTIITLPPSLLVAFYFYKKWKGWNLLKIAYFIPGLVSELVRLTAFYILADRVYPTVVKNLTGETVLGLMVDPSTQFGTVMFYNTFFSLAGGFLLMSSMMDTNNNGMSEAAMIDGANVWQEFWYVTLPSIFPILSISFIAALPGIFTSDFGLYAFFKMSGANVFSTLGSYFTVGILHWGRREYPYFAAFGIILSILSCILVFTVRHFLDKLDPYQDEDGSKRLQRRQKRAERKQKVQRILGGLRYVSKKN